MARNRSAEVDVLDEVEAVETEIEEVDGDTAEAKAPKAKKEPKRGDLPEGYVTPIGLAKELTEQGLHVNREGEVAEVRPQMVYSYIRNANKDHPFPIETVVDSLGNERQAVELEAGLNWWKEKNERVAARKASAAEKAAKKAERAAAKAEAEAEEAEAGDTEAVEAE